VSFKGGEGLDPNLEFYLKKEFVKPEGSVRAELPKGGQSGLTDYFYGEREEL
jgi:hypothetical protein